MPRRRTTDDRRRGEAVCRTDAGVGIGAVAEHEGHHPDIRFGWGYCTVELYTHKINGLHENDFIMAAKINALAEA